MAQKKNNTAGRKTFDPMAYMKSLVTPKKAKKAQVVEKVKSSRPSWASPTKKIKGRKPETKYDRARNRKIAKGNKSHGHGRKS